MPRTEYDALGPVTVDDAARWGAQTQRAVENFPISGHRLPRPALQALGAIKAAAARANRDLGTLTPERAVPIITAAEEVAEGLRDEHFPVDVFQTGSGTSSNMNANEVIAHRCAELAPELTPPIHPNDDVNRSQSSNDVMPSVVRLATLTTIRARLLPALADLHAAWQEQAERHRDAVTIGRTHLMDAMPMTWGQIFDGYAAQVADARDRLAQAADGLRALPLGGTAVGTGINAPAGFGAAAIGHLAAATGHDLEPAADRFAHISGIDPLVQASSALRGLAVTLFKPAEDLRWYASGPHFGLGQLRLPALQPGSSIMPGKVNPVIEEAVIQVCCHVIGGDQAVAAAGLCGHFALHTVLPLLAWQLPEHARIMANAVRVFTGSSVERLAVVAGEEDARIARHPVLVTALVPRIGHEAAVAIAQETAASGRPVLDVAAEYCELSRAELARLLDPLALARPHG